MINNTRKFISNDCWKPENHNIDFFILSDKEDIISLQTLDYNPIIFKLKKNFI